MFTQQTMLSGREIHDYNTILFPNMTADERERAHKNLLTYDDNYDLDVPSEDKVEYRATLGHKANHKFDANVVFCFAKHPR